MATKTEKSGKKAGSRPGKKKSESRTRSAGMSAARRDRLFPESFAFPKERKEPLNDAAHVRNAISRFDQVDGVTDAERDSAWRRIRRAAKRFSVHVSEKSWRELGRPRETKGKPSKGKKRRKRAKSRSS